MNTPKLKIRKKNLQQMYGLLQGGAITIPDDTPPDVTAPVISNIQVTDIGTDTATITWDTDEASTSVVDYGLTSSYTDQESDPTLVTSHEIILTGLDPETEYHFAVTSADASSNEDTSADDTFTTDVATVVGDAIKADASTDYAVRTAGTFLTASPFSVLFWIRLEENDETGLRVAWMMRDADTSQYLAVLNTGSVNNVTFGWWRLDAVGNEVELGLSLSLTLNKWYCFAISSSGAGASQTTIYRRAEDEAAWTSLAVTTNFSATFDEETLLTNGFNKNAGWFPGSISAVRTWNSAKTANELLTESEHYNPQSLTNLFASYPMENVADVAAAMLDQSGNGRNFTANGAMALSVGPTLLS